jgi:hypothetical protein
MLVLFGALALTACEREGDGVGAGNGSAGAGPSSVTVIDAGDEPRALLAYQIAPHSKESFTVTTSFAGQMGGDKTAFPTMEMGGDVVFADRAADGSLPFTFTSTKLAYQDVPGALIPAAKLNDQLKGVTMTVNGSLATSGRISGFKMTAENAPEAVQNGLTDLESSYSQLVAELPNVPVGKGAHWQRVVKIQDNGVDASQTMDFTLVDVQGSTVILKTAIQISAKPQHIAKTGAELKKFEGKGTYDATIDLSRMIGTSVMKVHVEQELVAMGQTVTLSMDSATATAPK